MLCAFINHVASASAQLRITIMILVARSSYIVIIMIAVSSFKLSMSNGHTEEKSRTEQNKTHHQNYVQTLSFSTRIYVSRQIQMKCASVFSLRFCSVQFNSNDMISCILFSSFLFVSILFVRSFVRFFLRRFTISSCPSRAMCIGIFIRW